MADVVVSDAARVPQDEGFPNISDGNEAWNSAGLMAILGQAAQSGSYVRSDSELDFSSHDGTNDTVDVNAGVAYISLAGETVDVQSSLGGASATYDTTIITNTMPAVCVILPSATTVNLQDSTLSSIWLAYDTDGTGPGSAGSVYLRSDDTGSVTAPSHPSVKLGEANPDDSSADILDNRFPAPTFKNRTITDVGARGIKTSAQAISSGTVTTVDLEDTNFEHSSVVDADLANNKLVIQEAGIYNVIGKIAYRESLSDGTSVLARVNLNGSSIADFDFPIGGQRQAKTFIADTVSLSANDELTLHAFHDHGSSRELAGDERNSIVVTKVG